jgi:hypothetical protein
MPKGTTLDALIGKAGSKELGCRGLVVESVRGSDTLGSFQFFPASQKTSPHYFLGAILSRQGASGSGRSASDLGTQT